MSRFARKLCILTIQLYQAIRSAGLIPLVCRFSPSCSAYAVESVRRCGVGRGVRLAFLRLLKCHPFTDSEGGFL